MRLIDADALMREYQERLCLGIYCAECTMTDKTDGTCLIERWIYAQPTIDAVPLEQYRSMERTCYKLQKALYKMADRKTEPQACEECEHWNDTEDGCADRHGCKTEQTEREIAKAIVHKMIDDAVIAEDAYPDLRQKMHDAVEVVRCRECVRSYLADGDLMCSFWEINGMDVAVCYDDYCSYGEREGE